ncbi:hypothetical protein COAQ111491_16430 [Comamonas aquatilis]|uniref:hypothetical protein n=1 Tax=Comamonas aquatilis TaxID=1778406 RepID=UPI0039EF19F6
MSRIKLSELSEDEFKAHIANGQTMKLGEINAALSLLHIDDGNLVDLGIEPRKARGAIHIDAADFPLLCSALVLHLHALSALCKHEHARAKH